MGRYDQPPKASRVPSRQDWIAPSASRRQLRQLAWSRTTYRFPRIANKSHQAEPHKEGTVHKQP